MVALPKNYSILDVAEGDFVAALRATAYCRWEGLMIAAKCWAMEEPLRRERIRSCAKHMRNEYRRLSEAIEKEKDRVSMDPAA